MTLTQRPPTLNDIPAVFELITACELALFNEAETEIEEISDQWAGINLEQDAWLAFAGDETLLGYAALFDNEAQFTFDFYTRPTKNLTDLKAAFVAQCEARARQKLAEAERPGEVGLKTYVAHHDRSDVQIVEAAGYAPRKYHFRMQIDYNGPPTPPVWPENTLLRTFIPGQDDRMVYDFIQTAFDWPGRISAPFAFERWHDFMIDAYNFEPELWFLLFDKETLIGAALCFDYALGGWVRQLGVLKTRRKQGIGAALLKHAFSVFYKRGRTNTALGVEANNPAAYAFYERLGMKKTRQFDEYYKPLQV